jgi:hypothetical protein
MDTHKAQRTAISILMESALYLTLPLMERRVLLVRLAESYPTLQDLEDEEPEIGYEASWKGIY